MLKIFSIVTILLASSDFGSSDIRHRTVCDNDAESCIECNSTIDKFDNGYSEANISYQPILLNYVNNFRDRSATLGIISNMKYTIWTNEYHNLMKNVAMDIGEGNISCTDSRIGDGLHLSIAEKILMGDKAPNETELRERVLVLIGLLELENDLIFTRFDTSRFGCFFGVKTSFDNNKPIYLLRCLFFADIIPGTRQITGAGCKNCTHDDKCSVTYNGLCVSKRYAEPKMSGASTNNLERAEYCVINAIVLLVLSLKLGF